MVPILVLASVIAFLIVDAILVARRRAARARRVRTAADPVAWKVVGGIPEGLYFHPGHAWARLAHTGHVTVGPDPFALRFAGSLGAIELPREGTRLGAGGTAWTLVSRLGRRLSMVTPLAGEVVEVNPALRDDPEAARRLPGGDGWFLKIRPDDAVGSIANLLPARLAGAWMELVRAQAVARLRPELGALAADGGTWDDAFGDRLSDARWEELRRALFPRMDSTDGGGDSAAGSR